MRAVRASGWALVVASGVVLLHAAHLLWFSGLPTAAEQRQLAAAWSEILEQPSLRSPETGGGTPGEDDGADVPDVSSSEPGELGGAYAALWFERAGQRIVHADVLYVVEGVTPEQLRLGPGRYPESGHPGDAGNVAIAGHRTTYGAPFSAVDELRSGDTIHVVDRQGREWVYDYVDQRVVAPDAWWVVDDDPLDRGAPTITLTTCHPRYSSAQRLIVWGELDASRSAPGTMV